MDYFKCRNKLTVGNKAFPGYLRQGIHECLREGGREGLWGETRAIVEEVTVGYLCCYECDIHGYDLSECDIVGKTLAWQSVLPSACAHYTGSCYHLYTANLNTGTLEVLNTQSSD